MVAFVGTMASAQSTKTCTKSKAACTKSKTAKTVSNVASEDELVAALPTCSVKAAAQLASADENITAKTCANSGHVSYYQKSVCSTSGKVSLKEVTYNSDAKAFVNVAPPVKEAAVLNASAPAKKAACKKSCAKTCSKSKAKATNVKLEEK